MSRAASSTSTSSPPVCDVCCDKPAQHVSCPACSFGTCRGCARRCVVDVQDGEACCPKCTRPWDTEETIARLGRAHWNGAFRKARRRRLLAQERARLPGTQRLAARQREQTRLRQLFRATLTLVRGGRYDLLEALRDHQRALYRLESGRDEEGEDDRSAASVPCARCRAPLLVAAAAAAASSSLVCSACHATTCRACGEEEEDDADDDHERPSHVCDPAILRSREAIARQCRPCPRCAAPSLRTEGCDVMWCAACHSFWHWSTGRVLPSTRTAPHNPDHRAWLAAGGSHARELGDVPCGGLPDVHALNSALLREFSRTLRVSEGATLVLDAARMLEETQRLREDYPRTWDEERVHEYLRVALLNGQLTEDKFAQAVERHDRGLHAKRDVGQLLEVLVFAGADVLQRFVADDDCDTTAVSLVQLREVADAALAHLGNVHARTVPRVDAQFRWQLPHGRQRV